MRNIFSRRKTCKGYSILELLIAMTVGVMVLIAASSWYLSVVKNHGLIFDKFIKRDNARIAFCHIKKDWEKVISKDIIYYIDKGRQGSALYRRDTNGRAEVIVEGIHNFSLKNGRVMLEMSNGEKFEREYCEE